MLSPICHRLYNVEIEFIRQVGLRPKAIYLGREESKQVDQDFELLREAGMVKRDEAITPFVPGASRRQWNGVPIFVVDAEQHLAVG